jgi:periplasmic copper chaperone A
MRSLHSLFARGLGLALSACLPIAATASPAPAVVAGDIAISRPWARATVGGIATGAVYLIIENRGRQPDLLLGASSPVAGKAMFHRTTQQGGMSRMAPEGAVGIPAGGIVKVAPSGLHLMLESLKQPLVAGQPFALTLRFQRAGVVTVRVAVIPLDAPAPSGDRDPATHQTAH